jgi:hypothetical protein
MARNKSFKLEVDDSTFKKNAKKLLSDMGVDSVLFMKQQTGLLARDLAKYTPPFTSFPTSKGTSIGTAKDIKHGKEAVAIGLYSICHIRKRKSINWARKSFGDGPIFNKKQQIAHGVIDDLESLATWHQTNRGARGRTRRVPASQRPFVFKTVFNKYLKKRQADVGTAKSSFYKASLALNAKGSAPANVKKNLDKAIGTSSVKKKRKGPQGLVSGRAKGAYTTKTKFLPKIQKDRMIKAMKRLKYVGNKLAKESFK